MSKPRMAVVLLLVTLAGGCAVAPPTPVSLPNWDQIQLERQKLNDWDLAGRAAVALGNDGWTANLEWRQKERRSELKLSGTFGVGGVRVVSDGQWLEIETSQGEKFSGAEALKRLQRTLNVSLPLESLRFWLLGIPQPGTAAAVQLDDRGNLSELGQAGWRIAYDRYEFRDAVAGLMPGRIVMEKEGVRVRLIVNRWRLT